MKKKIVSSLKIDDCLLELEQAAKILDKILTIKGEHTHLNVIEPYNQISMFIDSAIARAGLYSNVHPNKYIRNKAEKYEQKISIFINEMLLNSELYNAFINININKIEFKSKRVLEKILQNFKRSGVNQNSEIREKIKKINKELIIISQNFERNIRQDVKFIEINPKIDFDGLPNDYIKSRICNKSDKIKITTDYHDYIPFMMYSKNSKLREKIWKKFSSRGYPKNNKILKNMLQKRYELAKILGYKSYADYILENKMVKTPDDVQNFIDQINKIVKKKASIEYEELLIEKRKNDSEAIKIMGYEKSYYVELVKKNKFHFNSQMLRPYFQFENILNGLLSLTGYLFNIYYKKVTNIDVWHNSVIVYDIYEGKNILGRIFLDLHPRDCKYKHAAQFVVKSGVLGKQFPEGALICNFQDPSEIDNCGLMDHEEVVTLFHEFGHLLHHIFSGNQKWIQFSGVTTEWDFVEVPSQMLEEWAWDINVLQKIAKHYKTGKPISSILVKKMQNANNFGKGLNISQQLFYSALSLQYFNKNPQLFDIHKLLKYLQIKYSKIPYEEKTYFNLNFTHLDGYSAMYYTYIWSQVIAKDLLSPFKKDGMLNKKHSLNYKNKILELGGSKDANKLIKDFLGRDYNFDAFYNWLEENIKC